MSILLEGFALRDYTGFRLHYCLAISCGDIKMGLGDGNLMKAGLVGELPPFSRNLVLSSLLPTLVEY
jgi:hypothetical protein